MGWLFGHSTKKSLIADLTRDQRAVSNDRRYDCLRHCYRGNNYRGVLWTVQVVTDTKTNEIVGQFIGCYLLRYYKANGYGCEWGYKDMCESSHPFYYSCPLAYLELVPEECPEWRAQVREYHAARNKKLEKGKLYHAKNAKIEGHKVDFILVKTLRPLRGTASTNEGLLWSGVKFSRKHVGELVS